MAQHYTQEAGERIFDLLEKDITAIWENIEATPQDTTEALWKKKLTSIAREYGYSGRFALMRFLRSRAAGSSAGQEDFTFTAAGEVYRFPEPTLAHAESLTPQEHIAYLTCLQELAGLQADSDPEVDRMVISRAWHDVDSANLVSDYLLPEEIRSDAKKYKAACTAYTKENRIYKNRLTKEEAFQLGHILDFTLPEMQWFLLRTLDVAEGFRFNQSDDLIEAYGFLTGASWVQVNSLKDRYRHAALRIPREESSDRGLGWTRDVSDSLLGQVENWKLHPEKMDEKFLQWMLSQAPGLDLPSRTAGRLYRNLAAFAHDLITGEEIVPDEEEFTDCIQDVIEEAEDSGAARRLFYEDGSISPKRCKAAADTLLLENKIQCVSIQDDNTKAWHVLGTLEDGSLTSAGGAVNSGRSRVADLLSGKVQAEKSDMLYLLWFTANLIWQTNSIPDSNGICCRVFDFMDASRLLLEEALLPELYIPHPVEQSMFLSIVSGRTEEDSPSVVYEYMLQTLTRQRQRKKGSKRHDTAFKQEVVAHYRAHPELTLEECAAQFGIAPQTLSAWQKKLVEDGVV